MLPQCRNRSRFKGEAGLPFGFGPKAKNPSIEFGTAARMPISFQQIGVTSISHQSISRWIKTDD
jgi:hypothetical protein